MNSKGVAIFILPILTALLLVGTGCDFRGPEEGYDSDWDPDHEGSAAGGEEPAGSISGGEDRPQDQSGVQVVTERRPSDIIADTAGMQVREGIWQEERLGSSNYRIYHNGEEPEMIVERTEESIRSYFFNDGLLFYYTEEAHDGSYDLTVEFDDFGDVRGAQKLVEGRRAPARADDYAEIVKRATEISSEFKIKN